MSINKFTPGKPWLDINGNRIQAHGGSMFYENETFYWYGENKAFTVDESKTWHYGVKCYSSKDLYNWKDEGFLLEPSDDISNPLYPARIIDRPHIVYNKKTHKYVMWIKFAGNDDDFGDWSTQEMGIYISDKFLGKYEFVKRFRPCGFKSGDLDIAIDEKTDKAYIYFGKILKDPDRMVCCSLTDDYLDVTGEFSEHFDYGSPPAAREAPCFFEHNNKKYLVTSGTTGYHPNPTTIAVGENYHGPFTDLGDFCQNDTTKSTFHSQISCIFKHPAKKNLYIAMADRWLVDFDLKNLPWVTEGYRILQSKTDINKDGLTWQEVRKYSKRDISLADYVWLPILFDENNRPYIKWFDEWKIEDFE